MKQTYSDQLTDNLLAATEKIGLLISSFAAVNYEHAQHKWPPASNQITTFYLF